MTLPKWVIEDTIRAQYLGQNGWVAKTATSQAGASVSLRGQALSFVTEGEAKAYLAACRIETPKLFVGREIAVKDDPHKPIGMGGSYCSDFDPYEVA